MLTNAAFARAEARHERMTSVAARRRAPRIPILGYSRAHLLAAMLRGRR
jgi:hypothetical protein